MKKPFIYLFQATGNYYFYDVNKNQIVKINNILYKYLSEWQFYGENYLDNKEMSNEKKTINQLMEMGFLSSKHSEYIEHPLTKYCKDYLSSYVSSLLLQITQCCNMRCRYCSFSGDGSLNRQHQNKKMNIDTAIKAIDFLAIHSKHTDSIEIGFYGGEPLLEYDMIKKVVSYSKNKMPDKKIDFYMTTNGTILNNNIIDFLCENNFHLTISIDGPENYHDTYRRFAKNGKGTFNIIYNNLKRIRELYPRYFETIHINAVVDRDNSIEEIENYFNKDPLLKSIPIHINAVSDNYIDFNYKETEEYIVSLEELLFKQLIDKMRGVEPTRTSQYYNLVAGFSSQLFETTELPNGIHHQGPCMPGRGKLFVDINGDIRPCEKVSELCEPMIIGNVYNEFDIEKVKTLLNIAKLTEQECLNCWAIRLCKQCALASDDSKTLSRDKKLLECQNRKNTIKELLKDYVTYKTIGLI